MAERVDVQDDNDQDDRARDEEEVEHRSPAQRLVEDAAEYWAKGRAELQRWREGVSLSTSLRATATPPSN